MPPIDFNDLQFAAGGRDNDFWPDEGERKRNGIDKEEEAKKPIRRIDIEKLSSLSRATVQLDPRRPSSLFLFEPLHLFLLYAGVFIVSSFACPLTSFALSSVQIASRHFPR